MPRSSRSGGQREGAGGEGQEAEGAAGGGQEAQAGGAQAARE